MNQNNRECNSRPESSHFPSLKGANTQVVIIWISQEEHHKKRTFMDGYPEFLKLFDIDYDDRCAFKPIG